MPPATPVVDPLVQAMRAAVAASLLALVVLGVAWETVLAPTGSGTLALKVLPLLPGLPGVLRHRLRTYRWLSLLVWLYVLEGAVRVVSDRGPLSQWLAGAEVALSLVLFVACAAYVRRRLRNGAAATRQAADAPAVANTRPA